MEGQKEKKSKKSYRTAASRGRQCQLDEGKKENGGIDADEEASGRT